MQELSKAPTKNKKKSKKIKKVTWDVEVDGEEDEGEWTVVKRRKQATTMQVEMKVTAPETPLSSTLVVWTTKPEQLQAEMRKRYPAAAKLVRGVRVKSDHTILMATPNEAELLRSMEQGLQKVGIDAREYKLKQVRLAYAARVGLDQQVREAGVCNHFMQRRPCPFGRNCKFRCYKDGGWRV